MTVEEAAQRPTLVRPGLLVRDHDGRAGQASEDRPPQVRPEHVGVQDVEALPAQKRHEPREGQHAVAALATQRLVAQTRFHELVRQGTGVLASRAHGHVPALGRQVGRKPHEEALAASDVERVDQHQDLPARTHEATGIDGAGSSLPGARGGEMSAPAGSSASERSPVRWAMASRAGPSPSRSQSCLLNCSEAKKSAARIPMSPTKTERESRSMAASPRRSNAFAALSVQRSANPMMKRNATNPMTPSSASTCR